MIIIISSSIIRIIIISISSTEWNISRTRKNVTQLTMSCKKQNINKAKQRINDSINNQKGNQCSSATVRERFLKLLKVLINFKDPDWLQWCHGNWTSYIMVLSKLETHPIWEAGCLFWWNVFISLSSVSRVFQMTCHSTEICNVTKLPSK